MRHARVYTCVGKGTSHQEWELPMEQTSNTPVLGKQKASQQGRLPGQQPCCSSREQGSLPAPPKAFGAISQPSCAGDSHQMGLDSSESHSSDVLCSPRSWVQHETVSIGSGELWVFPALSTKWHLILQVANLSAPDLPTFSSSLTFAWREHQCVHVIPGQIAISCTAGHWLRISS